MALLIAFAFVAGAGTALSPCVLPVLPVALSAGATGGRRRPIGVATGLALSFTFATVALVHVIDALGLPDDLLRTLAIAVLLVFGLSLIVPFAGARVEALLSGLIGRVPVRGANGRGFWSGMLVGMSLGLVYAPCAGPILAGVITVSASQAFTAGRLAVAFAYGAGSALALCLVMLGGRRLTSRLARRGVHLQVAMGAVMVLVAVAMLASLDVRFETAIASRVPSILVNPTKQLETTASTRRNLDRLLDRARSASGPTIFAPRSSRERERPPAAIPAPEFQGTQRWFNTPGDRPLTMRSLRGRVVLVDFWTYTCINCIRTLPHLRAWDARYRSRGLTIVGVHTPEFPFEKGAANVQAAIARDGLRYPIVQDNDRTVWQAYRNEYWPAEYLIDAHGQVRFAHFGEGDYAHSERVIRALLAEAGAPSLGSMTRTRAIGASPDVTTPEIYLGAARADGFANGPIRTGSHDFGPMVGTLPPDWTAYSGRWRISGDSATALPGAALDLSFQARRVYLVLGSPGHPRRLRVTLDGRPIPASAAGADVHGAEVTVRAQRLYRLVDLPAAGRHRLHLRPVAGIAGYAFTFG